jgi:hypothetical protein
MAALLVGAGVAAGGFFVGEGISGRNSVQRVISVKGLSEREVPASIATWDVGYNTSGNDLDTINKQLASDTQEVVAFLKAAGFDEKEMAVQPPDLTDNLLEKRDKDAPVPPERYSASQSVFLRTAKVDLIKPVLASASGLMTKGVHLSGGSAPNYIFNQVNEIKPGMIEEATKNARIAADQFARDSQTTLGKLRTATQGWFQVENRDDATPERKVVRIVVDVQYELK